MIHALVLGSSGIIGSHLRITPHPGIVATYHQGRTALDLTDHQRTEELLAAVKPNVIINLAGESRPDVVQANPSRYIDINQYLPHRLAAWALAHKAHLIHVSTQAVFSGNYAPYAPYRAGCPVNAYGEQKRAADSILLYEYRSAVTIVRPSFVLGVRPNQNIGRMNPVELMLGGQDKQVADRWFSPSFAPDVAADLWDIASGAPHMKIFHLGVPIRVSRFDIALELGCDVVPVSHNDFPGIAERPVDTTYAAGSLCRMGFKAGIADCLQRFLAQRVAA